MYINKENIKEMVMIKRDMWDDRISYVPLMARKIEKEDFYAFRQLCNIYFVENKGMPVMRYTNTDFYYENIKTGTPYRLNCDISGTPFYVIFSKLKNIEINVLKINKLELVD